MSSILIWSLTNLGTSGGNKVKLYNLYFGSKGLLGGRVVENFVMFGFDPSMSSLTRLPKGFDNPICKALGYEP